MKLFLVLIGVTVAVAQTDLTTPSVEGSTEVTSVTETAFGQSSTDGSISEDTSQTGTTESSTEASTASPDERCEGDKFVYSEGCFDYCMKQVDKENVHIREVYPVFVENRICKIYSRLWFFFVSKEGVCKRQEVTRGGRTQVREVCLLSEVDN